jgi:hypothetical protein
VTSVADDTIGKNDTNFTVPNAGSLRFYILPKSPSPRAGSKSQSLENFKLQCIHDLSLTPSTGHRRGVGDPKRARGNGAMPKRVDTQSIIE